MAEIEAWRAANFPGVDAVYENGPAPEESKISSPWLDVEIVWYGGALTSVGSPANGRLTGAVAVRCFTREGEGTAAAESILDSLTPVLSSLRVAGANLSFPQHNTPTRALGWYKRGLLFPFKLDV